MPNYDGADAKNGTGPNMYPQFSSIIVTVLCQNNQIYEEIKLDWIKK